MRQTPGPARSPAFRGAVTPRAVVGRHRARPAHGVSYGSFPSDLPTVSAVSSRFCTGGAGTCRSARRCRSYDGIAEGFRGETVLPIQRRCQEPRPPRVGPGAESVRSPRRPDRRRPVHWSGSGVTVGNRRCALTSTRRVTSSGWGRWPGRDRSGTSRGATDLGHGRRTSVDEGAVRTARADARSAARPGAPSSACGAPLPPPIAGRTISSKRLRGTDSIPTLAECVRCGTREARFRIVPCAGPGLGWASARGGVLRPVGHPWQRRRTVGCRVEVGRREKRRTSTGARPAAVRADGAALRGSTDGPGVATVSGLRDDGGE